MYANRIVSIYRINLHIDRNNDEMLHLQTEDFEKRCFYFSLNCYKKENRKTVKR